MRVVLRSLTAPARQDSLDRLAATGYRYLSTWMILAVPTGRLEVCFMTVMEIVSRIDSPYLLLAPLMQGV